MSIKSEEIEKKIIGKCLSQLEKYDDKHFSNNYPMKDLLTRKDPSMSGNGSDFSHNPTRILIKAISEVMADELYKVVPRKKR